MARVKKPKPPAPARPPQLYHGAETCDFRPEWRDTDPELLALLRATFDADPDELTPQLVLADLLAERSDPRETWVRVGVELWAGAATLKPGRRTWNYDASRKTLGPVCETAVGWRVAGLWGCLVAWHGPSGYEGVPLGRTWVDPRVKIVQRCLWFWAMGFLSTNLVEEASESQAYAAGSQADAAWSQADAAWSQADAAGRQADAAGSQADAAGSQAYAAGRQAYAAGSQAYAAGRQADAAGSQADAAWRQAYAAGSQAYAAGRQKSLWRFARNCWESLCEPAIARLG